MNTHDFLEEVCAQIKYKAAHDAIKQELHSHIEDGMQFYTDRGFDESEAMNRALGQMGDAVEIGRMFNREYRLPFNLKFGLSIWSAAVTALIYAAYPLFRAIYGRVYGSGIIARPYSDFLIIGIILMFMAVNVLYLRRGRKITHPRDMVHVTIGFFIGYALSAAALILMSQITRAFPQYAYASSVNLPFSPPYIPFVPSDMDAFAMQFFCWWLCMVSYVASAKAPRSKPNVIWNWSAGISHYNGAVMVDHTELSHEPNCEQERITTPGSYSYYYDGYGDRVK